MLAIRRLFGRRVCRIGLGGIGLEHGLHIDIYHDSAWYGTVPRPRECIHPV